MHFALFPEAQARAAEAAVVPSQKTAKVLSLAIHNPNNPALEKLSGDLAERGFSTHSPSPQKSLDKAFALYKELSFATESKPGVFTITQETFTKSHK